jgi:hypothetical protein
VADTSLVFNIIAKDSGLGRALNAVQRAFRSAGKEAETALSSAGTSTENLDRMIEEARGRVLNLSKEFERTGDKKLFGQMSRDRSLISTLSKIRGELKDTGDSSDDAGSSVTSLGSKFMGAISGIQSFGSGISSTAGAVQGALGPYVQLGITAGMVTAAFFAAPAAIYAVGAAAASLPAMLSGAIAALFTLKLGLSGLSENWAAMNAPKAGGGGGGGAPKQDMTPKIRAVEAAQRQVARSTRDVADAQVALKEATEGVNKAREQEKERIEDVRRSLASARADEEDSVQSLAEARMQLALAETRGNPDEIRRAQIAVDKQAASLDEAKDKTEDLQKENDEAAKKGVEGSDAVVEAKKRERNAQRQVQDSIEAHKLAIQQLGDAQKSLNEKIAGAGAAAGGLKQQLPKIAASAREFLNELKRLKPAFDDLRLDVQQRLFQGLADKLRILAQNWLPALHRGLGDMADTMNGVVKTAFDSLSKPTFISNIMTSVDAFRISLGKIGQAVAGPLVDAFGRLASAARPFILMLGDKLAGIVTQFSNWIKKADESGKLQEFMEKATHVVGKLFDIFTDLARITGDVINILFGTKAGSTDNWDNLATSIHKVADWMGNPANQKKVSDFLNKLGGAAKTIAGAVVSLGNLLDKGKEFETWAKNAYNSVKGFFEDLPKKIGKSFSDLGNWFAALPGQVGAWLSALPGTVWNAFASAMINAAYLVGWGIGQIGTFFSNLPGQVWNWLKNLPSNVGAIIHNVVAWFRQVGPEAWNALKGVGSTASGALSDLPARMWNAGYNAVIGLWNGITGLWGWLWSKVYNLGVDMWNAFMQGIGARSPSRKFADAGKWAMLGAALGLENNKDALLGTAKRIAGDLASVPMELAGGDGASLGGQIKAAARGVVTVQAARRKQEVKVVLDVRGTDGQMKNMIQKMARTSNLLQTT